jgi:leader peptidase (prepilin peptidase)/N-methyltransferase
MGGPDFDQAPLLTRQEIAAASGLAVLTVFLSFVAAPGLEAFCGAVLALLMLSVAVFDRRYFAIPDEISATALFVGLCFAAIVNPGDVGNGVVAALGRGAAVAAVFWLVRFVYARLRKREGIGLGDVKLAAVGGVWLSLIMVPVAVELAAIAALGTYLLRQKARARAPRGFARLPFGAFLAPSIWLCWLVEAIYRQ